MTDTITVQLRVENHYPGDRPIVTRPTAVVPRPEPDEDLEDWAADVLLPFTGTGRTEGDAAYFVTVMECADMPDLQGSGFEWGL